MAISNKEGKVSPVKVSRSESRVVRVWKGIPVIGGRSKKPKKEQRPAGQMTFFEHLGELRNRLVWSCLAVLGGSIIGFMNSRDIAELFVDLAKPYPLVTNKLFDQFGVYMNLAIYIGLLLASPVIVYHVLAFLAPALEPESPPGTTQFEQELKTLSSIKRSLWFFIPFVAISFAVGIAFSYYFVVPAAVHFLINFSKDSAGSTQFQPLLNAKDFIGDITKILFWSGITFELPMIMFLLTKVRIVTVRKLVNWWKWALVFSLVAAAFITPSPDPASQALIAVPVFSLYWLGVLLARFA